MRPTRTMQRQLCDQSSASGCGDYHERGITVGPERRPRLSLVNLVTMSDDLAPLARLAQSRDGPLHARPCDIRRHCKGYAVVALEEGRAYAFVMVTLPSFRGSPPVSAISDLGVRALSGRSGIPFPRSAWPCQRLPPTKTRDPAEALRKRGRHRSSPRSFRPSCCRVRNQPAPAAARRSR